MFGFNWRYTRLLWVVIFCLGEMVMYVYVDLYASVCIVGCIFFFVHYLSYSVCFIARG